MNTDRFKFRLWNRNRNHRFVYFDMMNPCEDVPAVFPQDDEILEQCTGISDKNGKLIFEGDIVNDHCCHSWQNNTGIVQWSSRKSCFCIKWISGRDDLKNHEVMLFEWLNLHDETRVNVAIVGNIHENPEMAR